MLIKSVSPILPFSTKTSGSEPCYTLYGVMPMALTHSSYFWLPGYVSKNFLLQMQVPGVRVRQQQSSASLKLFHLPQRCFNLSPSLPFALCYGVERKQPFESKTLLPFFSHTSQLPALACFFFSPLLSVLSLRPQREEVML